MGGIALIVIIALSVVGYKTYKHNQEQQNA